VKEHLEIWLSLNSRLVSEHGAQKVQLCRMCSDGTLRVWTGNSVISISDVCPDESFKCPDGCRWGVDRMPLEGFFGIPRQGHSNRQGYK